MIAYSWINSIFWSFAPIFGWSKISFEPSGTSCTVDYTSPDNSYITYIIACFMFCFVLPIAVMIICQFAIKNNKKEDHKSHVIINLFN